MICRAQEEHLRFNFADFYEENDHYNDGDLYNLPWYHPYQIWIYCLCINILKFILHFLNSSAPGFAHWILIPCGYAKIYIFLKKHNEKIKKSIKSIKSSFQNYFIFSRLDEYEHDDAEEQTKQKYHLSW